MAAACLSQYTLTPSHQSLLYSGFRTTAISEPQPLTSGSQQGHNPPFSSHSVSLSTSIYHHLANLNPFFQLFQSLFPQLLSPETDRLGGCHGINVMLSGRVEVIEELLIRCGRDVMSHHVFIRVCICGHLSRKSHFLLLSALLPFSILSFVFLLQPRHAIKLLSVLNQMPQRHGPDTFFNFPGRSAAVSLTILSFYKENANT